MIGPESWPDAAPLTPPRPRRRRIFGLIVAAGVLSTPLPALTVARIFGDHMVLQRQQPILIWGGQVSPGVEVRGELRRDGGEVLRTATTRAESDGRWRLCLPAWDRPESTPLELRVTAGGETRRFRDVLVGEVWFCGGQSNMNMTVAHNAHRDPEHPFRHVGEKGGYRLPDYTPRIDGAIRHFGVEHVTRATPLEELAEEWDADPWTGNAWQLADSDSVGGFTAVGFYFARALRQALLAGGEDVPVGLVRASWGATFIEAWMSAEALATRPEFASIVEKRRALVATGQAKARAEDPLKGEIAAARLDFHRPSYAFNAMIHPLRHVAVRGFLWYQGENNTRDPAVYGAELRALIRDWRAQWGGQPRPFLWVQLPGLARKTDSADEQLWPALRAAQAQPLDEPATAMVVALDLGSQVPTPKNTDMEVHVRNKEPLGRRLALCALKNVYGRDVLGDSPRLASVSRIGRGLRLDFTTGGAGLGVTDGQKVRGLELAGSDGTFHPADRVTIVGDHLLAESAAVPVPQTVRYAWTNLGTGNLASARSAQLPQPGGPALSLGPLPVGTFQISLAP